MRAATLQRGWTTLNPSILRPEEQRWDPLPKSEFFPNTEIVQYAGRRISRSELSFTGFTQ